VGVKKDCTEAKHVSPSDSHRSVLNKEQRAVSLWLVSFCLYRPIYAITQFLYFTTSCLTGAHCESYKPGASIPPEAMVRSPTPQDGQMRPPIFDYNAR